VLLVALLVDGLLVVGGVALAPGAVRSVSGVGMVIADLGLLALIGLAAVWGRVALSRFADIGEVVSWTGVAFALVYDAHLLADFAGHPLSLNPYLFFVAAGIGASAWATYRTRRVSHGIAAACWALVLGTMIWSIGLMTISYAYWHTQAGYAFWLRDGAVSDYRHSGATSLWLFLLQDIQGAIFFHPLLSLVIGAACGAIGAASTLTAQRLAARL
jgi:hypothetical protein